jgi:hypothetical protein
MIRKILSALFESGRSGIGGIGQWLKILFSGALQAPKNQREFPQAHI